MNTYELIVGKDCKYSLEKSPYVMGRIMGILEGSGAETIDCTFRIRCEERWVLASLSNEEAKKSIRVFTEILQVIIKIES